MAAIPAVILLSWSGWTPFPSCLFRALTGLSCPTCGMTRAFQAAAHGDISGALGLNPAGTVVFLLLPLVLLKLSLESFTRSKLRLNVPKPLFRVAMALFIGLWLGFGVARMLLEMSA